MADPVILQRFPTERYKRFWYPTRPLFTIGLGLFLLSLGFIGILPMGWALWISAAFAFDDLPLTPIMNMINSINNLYHGRKQLKSGIMIAAITLAALTGGLLAFFVLSQVPIFMGLVTGFIAATSCSPLLISIGAVVGGGLAHFTNKISPFIGIMCGVVLMSFLPIPIPLIVDVVFICGAGLAFLASVVTKQSLRAYYKYRYGHSNADGYELDRSETEQNEFVEEQARKFHVTTEQFLRLVNFCKDKIMSVKKNATLMEEFGGARQPVSNSFKDIYHGLMNPHCTDDDVLSVKELLKISTRTAVSEEMEEHDPEQIKNMKAFTTSGTLRSDLDARNLYHQACISPGIEDEYIAPFTAHVM